MKARTWLPMAAIGLLIVGCASESSEYDESSGYAGSSAADSASYGADYNGVPNAETRTSTQTPPALNEMSTTSMTQMQRQVIRNGEISVRVEDVEVAERQITDMVIQGGGYVESSSASLPADNQTIDMTIRVVSQGFDDAMQQLAGLGHKLSSNSNTKDVTAQLVDLGARVKTLTAKEETFREMLRQSRTTNDIIQLQERLTQVRTEIERMEAQRKSLSQLASLSTIKVHLTENATMPVVASDPNWFGETFASTSTSFMGSVKNVVGVLLWVVIYAPFWGIPLFFCIWLWKKYGRPVTTTTTQ